MQRDGSEATTAEARALATLLLDAVERRASSPAPASDAEIVELARTQRGRDVGLQGAWRLLRRCVLDALHADAPSLSHETLRDLHDAIDRSCQMTTDAVVRAIEDEARTFASELEAVIRSMPEAVYIGDADGVIMANDKALALAGAESVSELRGGVDTIARRTNARLAETGVPIDQSTSAFLEATRGRSSVTEVAIRDPRTGDDVFLRSATAPVLVNGAPTGRAVSIVSDMTERHALAREREARLGVQELFIAVLGHDLRTPLNAIITAGQLLLQRVDERDAPIARRLLSSAGRMARLIEHVLDFVRLNRGIFRIETRPVDLRECLREVVDETTTAHPDRDIQLEAPKSIRGDWDPDRLMQALSNVLRNAVSYSPPDTTVRVRVEDHDAEVRIHVTNAGPRIPHERLARLFEPFGREPRERRSTGLGLGLFIVRGIARAHGGDATIESTAVGTTVTIRLPRRRQPEGT